MQACVRAALQLLSTLPYEDVAMHRTIGVGLLCALCMGAARTDYAHGADAIQRGDYATALRELVPAADSDARAASLLAEMYGKGLGTRADQQQALLWLRRAGELGDRAAQVQLGDRYAHGSSQDARESLEWYRRSAEHGSQEAMFALGRLYADRRGVPQAPMEAFHWMQAAAEAGSPQAAAWLAEAYQNGFGTAPDAEKAAQWRLRANPPMIAQASRQNSASNAADSANNVVQDCAAAG